MDHANGPVWTAFGCHVLIRSFLGLYIIVIIIIVVVPFEARLP